MSDDLDATLIDFDEPCEKCGYNLRGLRTGGKCPECGRVIPPAFPPEVDQDALAPFRPIAEHVGLPLDAVMFVWGVLGFAHNRAVRAFRRKGQFTAEELGWCFRDYALQEFRSANAARERLAGWRLTRSEQVGAVVAGIVKAEIWKELPALSAEEFEGVFEVDALLGSA